VTTSLGLLSLVSLSLVPSLVRADGAGGSTCSETYIRAQTLRNERKLLEAREALRTCAQASCKDFIVKDCALWLDQVQTSLPTIVPIATDAGGNDLAGVKLSMDGKTLVEKVEGRSVEVNPGTHTFTFEAPDGTKAEKQAIVSEGEKGKRIVATLGNAAPPAGGALALEKGTNPELSAAPSSWRTVGLVTAGAGVLGAGMGAVFGVMALNGKSDAGCDANSMCPNSDAATTLRDAKSAGNLSTIFFVGGGVLTAGGIALFALAPTGTVRATPNVGSKSVSVTLSGTW
jgi:hypothetical protein